MDIKLFLWLLACYMMRLLVMLVCLTIASIALFMAGQAVIKFIAS